LISATNNVSSFNSALTHGMKQIVSIILILLLCSFEPTHEYNLARFELRPKSGEVELYIKVDRLDMLKAIQKNCTDYNYLEKCFEEYFNAHTSFVFNGEKSTPRHDHHVFTDDFIEIYFLVSQHSENITEVTIINDLLFEISEEQENIVFSLLNNKRRSFRMNIDRREITIKY